MARPPVYDDALRERLLTTAIETIDHDGLHSLSLRSLAAECDTSTSAVYAFFGDKDGLLEAALISSFLAFGAAQQAAESSGLRALGVAYRDWAVAHPSRYRLMFSGSLDRFFTADGPMEQAIGPLVRTLAPRAGSIPVEIVAYGVWAQVHGAVSLELANAAPPALPWDVVYSTLLDHILRDYPEPPQQQTLK